MPLRRAVPPPVLEDDDPRPTFISTFAGIGGFDLGLERAGWRCVGQVEIDPYCQRVLKRHWPDVPLHNDIRTAKEWWASAPRPKVNLVTGGFPCQDVSVAGKRAGLGELDDEARTRTGLFFDAMDFIAAVRPEWVLLENVPGLLTSRQGRDFGTVLASLAEGGHPYVEWRVLDSQHFGVPQRRRRVFVVAGTRDPRRHPVLLEPEGVRGDPASGEQARPEAASPAPERARGRRGGVLADSGLVTSLTSSLGHGGPDLAHAQAGWIFPDDTQPQLMNNGQQSNDLARTITTGTGKRFDPDTESVVVAQPTYNLTPEWGDGTVVTARETDVSNALTVTELVAKTDRGVRIVAAAPREDSHAAEEAPKRRFVRRARS